MNEILKEIEQAQTICMIGHIKPDGDCIGATLGFYNYIRDNYPEKKADVFLGEFDSGFMFLDGIDKVYHQRIEGKTYDLCLGLDCSTIDRYGDFEEYYQSAKRKVVIDHHASNTGFGDVCLVCPDASATCEVIYTLLERDKIGRGCAEALYTGIVHDTGVFKHSNTKKETMEIAGDLIALGARPYVVIDRSFYSKSFIQNKILGEALLHSYLTLDDQVIVTCITNEIFAKYNASPLDVDGIVDQLRITRGIEVAVFVYELSDSKFKFSLRSNKYVDVSQIAVHFNGGGHLHASGFNLVGEKDKVIEDVLAEIKKQLQDPTNV